MEDEQKKQAAKLDGGRDTKQSDANKGTEMCATCSSNKGSYTCFRGLGCKNVPRKEHPRGLLPQPYRNWNELPADFMRPTYCRECALAANKFCKACGDYLCPECYACRNFHPCIDCKGLVCNKYGDCKKECAGCTEDLCEQCCQWLPSGPDVLVRGPYCNHCIDLDSDCEM